LFLEDFADATPQGLESLVFALAFRQQVDCWLLVLRRNFAFTAYVLENNQRSLLDHRSDTMPRVCPERPGNRLRFILP
jgi:hypothetical protein